MRKILSVDDSPLVRMMVSAVSLNLNYHCLEAEDGIECLKVLEEEFENIDLILMDWQMPRMGGLELLAILKNDERFKDIPVVVLSSVGFMIKEVLPSEYEVLDFITKPINLEELGKKIIIYAKKNRNE